jgi:hypothetical protein
MIKRTFCLVANYFFPYSIKSLVLGTLPEILSSILVAISRALLRALNSDSALWWSLVP